MLQLQNLSIKFGDSTAVNNISLEIGKGEVVCIVGESGSGKSATALSILGLLPTSAKVNGKIIFSENNRETNLVELNNSELRKIRGNRISMIFQEPMTSLNPLQTCGDQVMEALTIHKDISKKEAKQRTIELFNKVELPEPSSILNRYPHQLSGGQKQRVMIAMAMSCSPALLIADEPTTALDVQVQQKVLQLIKKLQQDTNLSVIFITHDLSLVEGFADKVVVMYQGGIVESGTAKEIFNNAQHPYTKALLACRVTNHQKGERLPVVSDFLNPEIEKKKHVSGEVEIKPQATQGVIMEVRNLSVAYPTKKNLWGKTLKEFVAVNNVSFDVIKGETLGLVGESGCGKTTLGRALLRLIEPTSGSIFFKGMDISKISDEEMRKLRKDVQIIFQDPYGSLNPRISIGNAIREPMKVHGYGNSDKQRKDMVVELLEKVDLKAAHFDRYPHEFSGGQRQRISIARALGLNPEFIVCDESVSALDISVQAQVLNLLNDLKKEFGFTNIFISHDIAVVNYLSDRVLTMKKGQISYPS